MFEVGFTELLVIFVLALIVLGPEKLPRLASQVGRWIGRARAMARQFREQLEDEVNVMDVNKWDKQTKRPTETNDPPVSDPPPPPAADETATSESEPPVTEGHHSGPPPEPEAAVYEPPAYATQPSATPSQPVESPADPPYTASNDDTATDPDERPARPGDVITTTHERGI
jgi:sec-independent protein translocase protein TatB